MDWSPFPKVPKNASEREREQGPWTAALRIALDDLARLSAVRPELAWPGRTLARLLEAAFGQPAAAIAPACNLQGGDASEMEAIRQAWNQSRPALHCVALEFDEAALVQCALSIARALQADGSVAAGAYSKIVRCAPDRVVAWVKLALQVGDDALEQAVADLAVEPALVTSVLRLVLLPALAPLAQRVCAQLPEGAWPHGQCPVCGSRPALAESRGLEERRHLRCDRCGADWPANHFCCVFCGESDHRALLYQFVQGEADRYRVASCGRCGGRLKIVATLAPLSPPGLLVAELATVHLDFIDVAGASSPD